jgi:Cu/Ag efflux protein CusF
MVAYRITAILIIALALGCRAKEPAAKDNTYAMTATIVSRDPAQNTVNLDNKEVPGVMEAMTMDYSLRGAKVDSLPSDGTAVHVTLHEQDGRFWVTDVKPINGGASPGHR